MSRFIANLMNNHEIASSFFFFGLKLQSFLLFQFYQRSHEGH
ncbi:hypothetical protein HanRHA438_Chr04g0162081 [Helianthus annuus]|nr:hypothetical protein HanRHA438_Chr04g0162081 [Helianthus annuus]KAJ0930191.1 hypothetical protein HanPSC8_Chr04g0146481 [Helianthus annuus]